MHSKLLNAVMLLGVILPSAKAEEGKNSADDLSLIKGEWTVESYELYGIRISGEKLRKATGHKMTSFTDAQYTATYENGVRLSGSYQLNASKSPGWFEETDDEGPYKGVTRLAIYKFVDRDTLVICEASPDAPRPRQLTSVRGGLMTLKRIKR